MTKAPHDGVTRQANRVMILERRMRQLLLKRQKTGSNLAEISALEWAIPILEKYLRDTFGEKVAFRVRWYKHEKLEIAAKLWDRDGDICYLCDEKMNYQTATIDHVIPLAKNGKDDMSNYRLVHEHCNVEKGNMLLEVYLEWKAKQPAVTA